MADQPDAYAVSDGESVNEDDDNFEFIDDDDESIFDTQNIWPSPYSPATSSAPAAVLPSASANGEPAVISVTLPSWQSHYYLPGNNLTVTTAPVNGMTAYEYAKAQEATGTSHSTPPISNFPMSKDAPAPGTTGAQFVANINKVKQKSLHQHHFMGINGTWDPSLSSDWDQQKPSDMCTGRIARDLHSLYLDPIPGIQVYAYESNVTKMLCLIAGPEGTPYEGGFFQFYLRCPPDYPISHPRVRLLTTGEGTVRFNPNLYSNGKVCLSLLGTWSGPAWSPALNISTLLLSIQSLMNEFPYRNEPGLDKAPETSREVINYNLWIQHETVRVAVIGMTEEVLGFSPSYQRTAGGGGGKKRPADGDGEEGCGIPLLFRKSILSGFLKNQEKLMTLCDKNTKLDGSNNHAFGSMPSKYRWAELKQRLADLRPRVETGLETITQKKTKSSESVDAKDSD